MKTLSTKNNALLDIPAGLFYYTLAIRKFLQNIYIIFVFSLKITPIKFENYIRSFNTEHKLQNLQTLGKQALLQI